MLLQLKILTKHSMADNTLLSDNVTLFNISYKPTFEILLCLLKEERVMLCFIFPLAHHRDTQ